MLHSLSLPVTDASHVGEARRRVTALCQQSAGFDAEGAGRAALLTTELATNVLRHGGGGELVVRLLEQEGRSGVELLALDRGPGMADPEQCLRDGFSTGGSSGTGLGAVRRGATRFELYAPAGGGTALWVQLWPKGPPAPQSVEVGSVCVPYPGSDVCGDAWCVVPFAAGAVVVVADGLGHGPLAAEASLAAIRQVHARVALPPEALMQEVHGALRRTRGAAVALASVDLSARSLTYVGVGNIAGAVLAHEQRSNLVSLNGTVGKDVHRIQPFPYLFPPGALLVMHSDGLGTGWRTDRYPGLLARHPALVAGVLYRDYKRGRDDATVTVLRETVP